MSHIHSRGITIFFKVYITCALVAAAILSHPALSFIPIIVLVSYLFLWRWPIRVYIHLLTDYFMFFTIAILLVPFAGPFISLLISLPVLVLVTKSLQETAELLSYQKSQYTRHPTSIGITLALMALLALCISLLLSSLSLLLASVASIVYLGTLGAISVRKLPSKPVEETPVHHRMVAGARGHLSIDLTTKTKIGGKLFFESPYEWLKISPSVLSLKVRKPVMEVTLTPPLLGPSIIKIKAYATDRWGLVQTAFELEPIHLYVIPRARYAVWLARKYLSEIRIGTIPMTPSISTIKPTYGLRRGVEYYGSQLYQSGDSLKNIDWKHSLQYNELITKEFTDFYSRPAIILINLATGDAEDADKLVYKIITTAISLAQENIPAALAAYDHEGVKLTTAVLQSRQLLLQSLKIIQEVVSFSNPVRYLDPPDITRLRADMSRIRSVDSKASRVLAQLLQIEYESLNTNIRANPASQALSTALDKAGKQSNVVIISQRNHDVDALAFNTFHLTRKGNAVISM